jgi:hypothetical protein
VPLVIGNLGNINSLDSVGWWIGWDTLGGFAGNIRPSLGSNISFAVHSQGFSSWRQCAVVFSRKDGLIRYFMDGKLAGQSVLGWNAGDLGAADIVVGGAVVTNYIINIHGQSSTVVNKSLLNELSVWRRALGDEEIQAMYDAGSNGRGIIQSALNFQKGINPREPLNIVHDALDDLGLLQLFQASPVPIPRLVQTFNPTNASVEIVVYGEPGLDYVLESSTNLSVWQTYTTLSKESSGTPVSVDQSGSLFFRAKTPE